MKTIKVNKKAFRECDIKKYLSYVTQEMITFSRFVEILNQTIDEEVKKRTNGLCEREINSGKTISEAAEEYAAQEREQLAFADGAKWAQRWISVEDELPEKTNIYFVKYKISSSEGELFGTAAFYKNNMKFYLDNPLGVPSIKKTITHWRPVELK